MSHDEAAEREGLDDDVRTTLLEGRTILPGVQTLSGFQLAVIFTVPFQEKIGSTDQIVHFVSLTLGMITIAILLLPAAYHRIVTPGVVSRRFARFATRCMKTALGVMAIAMALNFFLVIDVIFRSTAGAIVGGALSYALFMGLWFVLPAVARKDRSPEEKQAALEDPPAGKMKIV